AVPSGGAVTAGVSVTGGWGDGGGGSVVVVVVPDGVSEGAVSVTAPGTVSVSGGRVGVGGFSVSGSGLLPNTYTGKPVGMILNSQSWVAIGMRTQPWLAGNGGTDG